ncbi:hypothetical protein AVP41_02460 [Microbacterium sp. TNHR37B]|nr:hypothetical protein AVP41_02460 [Microbacterium sp. TNHR37B]
MATGEMGSVAATGRGCAVCQEGAYTGGQPRFVVSTSPVDLLYRCDLCRTWWLDNGRALRPMTDDEARDRFPAQVSAD